MMIEPTSLRMRMALGIGAAAAILGGLMLMLR